MYAIFDSFRSILGLIWNTRILWSLFDYYSSYPNIIPIQKTVRYGSGAVLMSRCHGTAPKKWAFNMLLNTLRVYNDDFARLSASFNAGSGGAGIRDGDDH